MTSPDDKPPQSRPFHWLLTVVLIGIGLVMLLPGLCSALFMLTFIPEMVRYRSFAVQSPGIMYLLWAVGFAISWAGVLIIRRAVRGRR